MGGFIEQKINKAEEVRKFIRDNPDADGTRLTEYSRANFGDPNFLPRTKFYKFRQQIAAQGKKTQAALMEEICKKLGPKAELEDFRAYKQQHGLQIEDNRFYEARKKYRQSLGKADPVIPKKSYQPNGKPQVLSIVETLRAAKALIAQAGGVDNAKALLDELR